MGLEGSGASLLGTGVRGTRGLVKAFFASVDVGVFSSGPALEAEELGELVDFFWRSPKWTFGSSLTGSRKSAAFFVRGEEWTSRFPQCREP